MGRWKGILDKGVEQKVFRPMNTELMANYLYFLCNVWSLRHWSIGKFPESEIRTSLKALIMDGVFGQGCSLQEILSEPSTTLVG